MLLIQEEIFEALGIAIDKIESAGASPQLTDAVILVSDLRAAIGNQFNPAQSERAKMVRAKLNLPSQVVMDSTPRTERFVEAKFVHQPERELIAVNRIAGQRKNHMNELEQKVEQLQKLVDALTLLKYGWDTREGRQARYNEAYSLVSRNAERKHLEAELKAFSE